MFLVILWMALINLLIFLHLIFQYFIHISLYTILIQFIMVYFSNIISTMNNIFCIFKIFYWNAKFYDYYYIQNLDQIKANDLEFAYN